MSGLNFGDLHSVLDGAVEGENYHVPVIIRVKRWGGKHLTELVYDEYTVGAAAVELVSEDNSGKVYQLVLDAEFLSLGR